MRRAKILLQYTSLFYCFIIFGFLEKISGFYSERPFDMPKIVVILSRFNGSLLSKYLEKIIQLYDDF